MYYLEWTIAMGRRRHAPGSWLDEIQKDIAKDTAADERKLLARGLRQDLNFRDVDIRESRSDTVDDNGAIYCKTNAYLDVCTCNDDKRGMLSMVLIAFCYGMLFFAQFLFELLLGQLLTGKDYSGADLVPDGGFWLAIIGSSVVTPLLFYVFFRYLLKFWRLEAFTMRRLVVRFNRETRKVYFLRPTFLGGVKAYNWAMTSMPPCPKICPIMKAWRVAC